MKCKCNVRKIFQGIQQAIENFKNSFNCKSEADAAIIIICTHGRDQDRLFTNDGEISFIQDIVEEFYDNKAPMMKGIPKIFLQQACRGNGNNISGMGSEQSLPRSNFNQEDILIIRACLDGQGALHCEKEGSLLIREFCKALDAMTTLEDITETIEKVGHIF